MTSSTIRQPAVAGMFYPAKAQSLNNAIDLLIAEAPSSSREEMIVALISPHAGYEYSGFTAAHGFTLLKNCTFDTVVVVSPSHREYFDGISVYDGSAYPTPLGDVLIDESLRRDLLAGESIITASAAGHGKEHALEVQLPFLQRLMKEFSLLPIVMGDQRREYCFHLGKKLASILKDKNALLIASTDLSHHYPYEAARKLDKVIIEDISKFDYEELMNDLEHERAKACGGGPTVAVLLAAKRLGANRIRVLHQCNSGDVTGDRKSVVGYLSAVALRAN